MTSLLTVAYDRFFAFFQKNVREKNFRKIFKIVREYFFFRKIVENVPEFFLFLDEKVFEPENDQKKNSEKFKMFSGTEFCGEYDGGKKKSNPICRKNCPELLSALSNSCQLHC